MRLLSFVLPACFLMLLTLILPRRAAAIEYDCQNAAAHGLGSQYQSVLVEYRPMEKSVPVIPIVVYNDSNNCTAALIAISNHLRTAKTAPPPQQAQKTNTGEASALGRRCITLANRGHSDALGWVYMYRNNCSTIFEIDFACPGERRSPHTHLQPTTSFRDEQDAFSNCKRPGRPKVWFKSARAA